MVKRKMFFFILIFVVSCLFTEGVLREHIFLSSEMNWTNAQQYCRQHYRDLSTIASQMDRQIIRKTTVENQADSWIGLYRNLQNSNTWTWSDGEPNMILDWKTDQPNNYNKSQNCVKVQKEGWNDYYCWERQSFFCERILVLVKENKTWEEALKYCRDHYKDLALLASDTQLDLAKIETNESQTSSVWTGLRFLAGQWLWVSGDLLGSLVSLPSCPAERYRCGSRNFKVGIWENRNCEEKLNFLCN